MMPAPPTAAPDQVFVYPVRVYWEDTDAGGIVYYANYLKFMERARTEWLREIGCDQAGLRARHRLQFVVSRARVEFRHPARFDDRLDVGVRVIRARRATVELAQDVRRTGSELVCRAEIRIGCVDIATFRPRGIPLPLTQELELEH